MNIGSESSNLKIFQLLTIIESFIQKTLKKAELDFKAVKNILQC